MNKEQIKNKGEIIIYQNKTGKEKVVVRLEKETIWLDAHQMAKIFEVDRTGVVRHISNIYKAKELDKKSTCAKIAQVAKDGKIRKMDCYNLDMIISVGYRVNSKKATQFRIWATGILKDYVVRGYSVNKKVIAKNYEKFIKTVEDIKQLLPSDKNFENRSIIELVETFADTWLSLDAYDRNELTIKKVTKRKVKLTAKELGVAISDFKAELIKKKETTDLFAKERKAESLEGIIGSIMQSFGGQDMYPSLEEKAAHLLYFMVKNHPFVDGNKRSGAYAFVWFLKRVNILDQQSISPTVLTVITLLIAESKPRDKDKMTALVVRMLEN